MADQRRPGKLEALLALISTGLVTWYMMPPQERVWLKLRLLSSAHRLTGQLARRAGHKGMGDELAGREYFRYAVAMRLSEARDALGKALEEMRP